MFEGASDLRADVSPDFELVQDVLLRLGRRQDHRGYSVFLDQRPHQGQVRADAVNVGGFVIDAGEKVAAVVEGDVGMLQPDDGAMCSWAGANVCAPVVRPKASVTDLSSVGQSCFARVKSSSFFSWAAEMGPSGRAAAGADCANAGVSADAGETAAGTALQPAAFMPARAEAVAWDAA